MIITSADKEYTKKQERISERLKKEEIRRKKCISALQITSSSFDLSDDDSIESPLKKINPSECVSDEDDLYQPSFKKNIGPKELDVGISNYEPKAKITHLPPMLPEHWTEIRFQTVEP